jgi:type I restriction enzyme S subunit
VLKAAVEGRLVPTEAEIARAEGRDYEPASVLLDRILAERRRRWAEAGGKGKYKEPALPNSVDLPPLPEGWGWAAADQSVSEGRPICYGVLKAGPHEPGGVPIVRVTDIVEGELSIEKLKRCSPARESLFARARLKAGDLVISKDGSIGFVAIVPPALDGANITQHVLRMSIHKDLNAQYFATALRSPPAQAWMKGETRGVALRGINVEDFRRLPLPIPPLAEQHRIVAEVDRRLSVLAATERAIDANLARCAQLRQSILKRAFEGRLVQPEAPLAEAAPAPLAT